MCVRLVKTCRKLAFPVCRDNSFRELLGGAVVARRRRRVFSFSDRIDITSGKFSRAGDSDTVHKVAKLRDPRDGVFVDIGGWIGDSSFPSAALGFDTFVFEPARYNSNLMHTSLNANPCFISKQITIVNAMASTFDGNSTVYVTGRGDNTAMSKKQATSMLLKRLDYLQRSVVLDLFQVKPSSVSEN